MVQSARSEDTTAEAQAMLIARWRSMTIAERVALVRRMCEHVELLARGGIVARRPELTEPEIKRELARRRYGSAIAETLIPGRSQSG